MARMEAEIIRTSKGAHEVKTEIRCPVSESHERSRDYEGCEHGREQNGQTRGIARLHSEDYRTNRAGLGGAPLERAGA